MPGFRRVCKNTTSLENIECINQIKVKAKVMETQTLPLKPIGGYIELQLNPGRIFHSELLPLNTGRNALEYILRVRKYNLIYLPYYTCDVLLEPLHKLNVACKFYKID